MRKIFLMVLFFYINTISSAEVSFEQLLNASKDPENWLTYSGTYRSERFALQDQINISNVNQLKTIWAYQMQPSKLSGSGLVETTPIVANEIMYITEPPSTVTALDVKSGKRLWTWSPDISENVLNIGFPLLLLLNFFGFRFGD